MPIRDAAPADFGAIAEITNHYILNTHIHFGDTPVSPEQLREQWQRTRTTYPFLVLTDETDNFALLGYAKASRWRERAAYDRTAETSIYLRHDLCSRGLGGPLYRALIDACHARDFHALIGGIALPNPSSVALHERLGFRYIGTHPEVGWKFNAWHSVGFYQLTFSEGVRYLG